MDDTHPDEEKPVLLDSPSDTNTTTTPSSDQSREVTYEIMMANEVGWPLTHSIFEGVIFIARNMEQREPELNRSKSENLGSL